MCSRCLRMLLLVLGSVLLFLAVFPVLAVVHLAEPLATDLMAAKLLMLPVGAVCLLGAAGLQARQERR